MGQLISKVYGTPLIQKFKRFLYRNIFKIICSDIDCYFPITATSLNQINDEFGLQPIKSVVIYSGVPLDFRDRTIFNNPEFRIGVASQLIYEKGIDIVIIALQNIKKIEPKAKLLIAGHGPEKNILIELSKSHNVYDDIIFLDFVEDMSNFMASLDLFIFPARPSYDGLPRVILEAMIQRTPVIASNTPEINEIITLNSTNGLLFDIGSSESLFEMFKYFHENKFEIESMIDNGYKMACSISVSQNVKLIQNTYQDLLNDQKTKSVI
jgi:glycosyltransferase involved in cell wall biosynthesis